MANNRMRKNKEGEINFLSLSKQYKDFCLYRREIRSYVHKSYMNGFKNKALTARSIPVKLERERQG